MRPTHDPDLRLSAERAERVSRNLLVTEWSLSSQIQLERTRFLVVGCGGLAAHLLPALVGAGAQHLTLVDDDRIERSNLNRQVLFDEADIGVEKATATAIALRKLDRSAVIEAKTTRVTTENARRLVRDHDVVLDCTDGLPSKYLVNDAAVVEGRALIHGAVTGLSGQVLAISPGGGPCLRCLFPTLPAPGTTPTCQQAGVLAPVVTLVASVMAIEVLRAVGLKTGTRDGRLIAIDARGPTISPLSLPSNPSCLVCGNAPEIDATDPDDYVA